MSRRSLGTLTVDLIVKMGGFEQGMSRASRETKKRMREIQKSVDETAKRVKNFIAVGAAAVATGAAITAAMVNSARQSIDSQAKLARSLDTTYDSLTALQMRAGDSGIDGLEASLNRMNRRLGAVEMNAGPAVKTVKALRLDLEAMANMGVDERIGYIGDRIREMNVSNEEAARHLQQLGFEQAAAIELFRDGSDAVDRYRKEVDGLGLSMDDLDAQRVEQMNDALGIFNDMQLSIANRLTTAVAPSILSIAESIEEAWIQTDNFGLASVEFEESFRSSVAGALDATADLVDFMELRGGDMATFGLIGYLFFGKTGRAGAAIGAAVGYLFSELRMNMARLGIGVDEQAAELIRLEERAAALTAQQARLASQDEATAAVMGRGPNPDGLQAKIDETVAAAAELREAMGPAAWADFNKYFGEAESSAEGFSGFLREAADSLQTLSSGAPPGSSGGDGRPDGFPPEDQEELLAIYQAQEEALHRQLTLYGDTSAIANLMYEMEQGSLAELNPMMKERLLYMQQQLDAMDEETKADLERQERLDQQRKVTEQFAIQAARNVQNSLAEYLFDPFDEGLKGMLKGLGDTLRRMATQIASQKLLSSLFSGMSNSNVGWLSSLGDSFAGAFDSGGNIPAGQWGIAGEIGPEIVRGPAMVTSRTDTARALGANVSINVINNAGVNVRQGETRFDGGRTMIDVVIEAVRTGMRQGDLDQDLAATYGITRAGGNS
ncbi:hypothetical protein PHACT_12530 [Pseudohongiella acticola]|uniref:Bacteriophage tail tape measure C-terminal domain-containing protein n=1 Tax=Pseudohongiella acticola TaxID=1524254 RepID=A0A1E8CGN8_9GAMM|nr:hypothetical protein [Pseudohongiella acticola]OFE11377.1 hypothetical protein PHACT_12530 [Pseudohongiella acticola]